VERRYQVALLDTRGHFTSLGDDESDEVYRRVYESVLAHQLRPGTRLPEEKLAAIFGVSRTKVRKVIARLEHEQVVEVVHNRGAFVAHPSADQASDTLEARRIIEPAIVQSLAEKAKPHDIDALRRHLTSESAAVKRGDKPAYIRLSGEFHNLVAELAGNDILARMLRELTARTSLTILLYDTAAGSACMVDEHALMTDAVERHDAAAAAEIMARHLKDVENSLVFDRSSGEVDLAAIFG
jgi:DNA-binding GntR family transcriptional regulator